MFNIKEISEREMNLLIKKNIIYNSHNGYVDTNGNKVGFYATKHKTYIEDKYVDISKTMS